MNIDELTLGQIKQLQSLFNPTAKPEMPSPFTGRYCIARTRNAGVIFGKVIASGDRYLHMIEARRLWRIISEDKTQSWYEGVCSSGLDISSKVSSEIERFINEEYELSICTDVAIKSIKEFKTNETTL